MKRRLWVAAALAPLSFAAMTPIAAHADTTVTGSSTTPLDTATAGNITVTGTLHPATGPAAITIDSSNTLTVTGGAIRYNGVSDSADVLVNTAGGPLTSTITNGGVIENDETTSGNNTNQGIVTGPFATGTDRFGIEIVGPNAFNGSITNTGSIIIIGENSAGIAIGSTLNGSLLESGTITVTGGTLAGDVSYAINATGPITGNATIGGTIAATGQNATGVALSGDVGGAVDISATITATGYRSTTAPTDPKVLQKLNADQLLQGGPAVVIGGNVAQGIFVNTGSSANGNIAAVGTGTLTVYGSAPVMLIGGNQAITIGPTNASIITVGGGPSLVVGGTVTGVGDYGNVSATGIQIGGLNPLAVSSSGVASGDPFGAVDLNAGIAIEGSVEVSSESHAQGLGDATAILIGSGATVSGVGNVSALSVDGTVLAVGRSDALVGGTGGIAETSITGQSVPISVTAIDIQPGASVTTIDNTGSIGATLTGILGATNYIAAGGTQGQAVGILDASGSVTSLTNSGVISAAVTPIVSGQSVDGNHTDAVAVYLGNVNGNVSVVQTAGAGNASVPGIIGALIFGNTTLATTSPTSITGSENLDIEAGSVIGAVVFNGAGANSLTINNGAALVGSLTQSSLGSLSIDVGNGTLGMTSPTSNTLGGQGAAITVSSLHIGAAGAVDFAINPTAINATAPQFDVTGAATLDNGAKLGVAFTSKLTETETFTLITATSLSAGNITAETPLLPFLYQGNIGIVADGANTDIDLTVTRKTPEQLGFNTNQAAAYNAIFSQMSADQQAEQAVLNQNTQAGLFHIYNQFLPDYAGGVFESLASGQRAIANAEAEQPMKLQSDGPRGWVQEIGFMNDRSNSAIANGYTSQGFGLAGGVEAARGKSAIGATVAFLTTGVANDTQVDDASLSSEAFEAGLYWRGGIGNLTIDANVNGGYVALGSHRLLLSQTSAGAVTLLRDAESQWSGLLGSGQIGLSYQMAFGRFYMRPEASADYIALYETKHTEHGGVAAGAPASADALDLAINSRLSREGSVQGDLVFGYTFGDAIQWRPEMMIGYREIVTGGPGNTTAKFVSGGSPFTLTPDLTDRGGFLARLGLHAGGTYADVSANAGGEFRDGYSTYDARATARFLF